jgi:hypothetical protein
MLQVQGYKQYPGGIFPAIHEAIIDNNWQLVQNKRRSLKKISGQYLKTTTLGDFKCHCGNIPTGAPSRGKSESILTTTSVKRLNIIILAQQNNQLAEIFELMSLPQNIISDIKSHLSQNGENLKSNKLVIDQKKILLNEAQEKNVFC